MVSLQANETSLESASRTSQEEKSPIEQNNIMLLLDKPFYLPGQRIQGQARVNLKSPLNVKFLDVYFQGSEYTHIYVYEKHGGTFSSTRMIANTGLRLSQQATTPAGTTTYPFAFDIPRDALPSYAGKTRLRNMEAMGQGQRRVET